MLIVMKPVLVYQFLTVIFPFVSYCMETHTECYIPECEYKTAGVPPNSLFSINDQPVPTIGYAHLIINENVTECRMNMTQALLDFNLQGNQSSVCVFGLVCYSPYLVHLMPYEDEHIPNTWFYFQMLGCETTTQSLSRFSRAVDLRVITSHQSYIHTDIQDCGPWNEDDDCHALLNVLSIWTTSSTELPEQNFTQLFACNETFSKMNEVSVDSMSWTDIPSMFRSKFPNLQSLEMPNCNLSTPPQFPWATDRVRLPDNLTMGAFFLEQYATVYHVKLNPRFYRRLINLNSNNIQNLAGFKFTGYIQMIRLKNNGLEEVGSQTFSQVDGLQHLDLSENKLSFLPTGVFRKLSQLHHLKLENNEFRHLKAGVFKNLRKLRVINLANNSLSFLEEKLFEDLENIEKIYLQKNYLKTVEYTSFPVTSITLTELHFDHNPLTTIPDVVFYIRNLALASLRFTSIEFETISEVVDTLIWAHIVDSVLESSSTAEIDFFKKPSKLKTVDLSNSKVEIIKVDETMSEYQNKVLLLILKNFEFLLKGNDLKCDCHIVSFSNWIYEKRKEKLFDGSEYFFKNWLCSYPIELRDRKLLQVQANETYCERNVTDCPEECTCFVRTNLPITIVDCRNSGLLYLPEKVPSGEVDLWFQNNNISEIENRNYLPWVRQLYLSHNTIEKISPNALLRLKRLESLYLDSNLLADLPKEIRQLPLMQMVLKNNPFRCDCKTLWMKKWLLNSQDVVSDWAKISCNDASEQGRQFIGVPDEDFICVEEFDSMKHVVTPSVSASVALTTFFVCSCILHVYRYEAKVLLYIYTGCHPFDRDAKDGNEDIDALIIHADDTTGWVLENLVALLETPQQPYVVCEISRDFVAGFSFQENIVSMVNKSKRMILVLSENMTDEHDLCKVAWNEAQEKIKELRTNYTIFVSHGFHKKKLVNKDIIRYIKRSRFIDTKSSFLKEKIIYGMPNKTEKGATKQRHLPDIRQNVLDMYDNQKNENETHDAFIVYNDNNRHFALNDLRIFLEKTKYQLIFPDRDFLPGTSKEENILKALSSCRHTIFILSDDQLEDEWSLFTFRSAVEKSLRDKCNHLIVLTVNERNIRDEEVRHYLKTHVVLDINSQEFWKRLKLALPKKDVVENGNNVLHDREMKPKKVKEQTRILLKDPYEENFIDGNPEEQTKVVGNVDNSEEDQKQDDDTSNSMEHRAKVKEMELEQEFYYFNEAGDFPQANDDSIEMIKIDDRK